VFLLEHEVLFLFETDGGTQALEELLTEPDLWRSAEAWHEIVAGPPQIAEDTFSWVKPAAGSPESGREPYDGLGF
jgi:hypothetical protein